jgi:hypothetical protein
MQITTYRIITNRTRIELTKKSNRTNQTRTKNDISMNIKYTIYNDIYMYIIVEYGIML